MRDRTAPETPGSRPPVGRLAVFAVVALATAVAVAAPKAQALFIVNQPWVKPGTHASEAYMILTSTEGATLIGGALPDRGAGGMRGPGTRGRARTSLRAARGPSRRFAATGQTTSRSPGSCMRCSSASGFR